MSEFARAKSGLLIPENVTDATEEYVSAEQAAQDIGPALEFRKLLKQLDPRLDVLFAKPGATAFPQDCRWYIIRRNEQMHDTYWVIQGEDGGYCAPSMRHFDRFREFDTHANPGVWKRFEKEREARKLRAESAMEEKRREFREKLTERLDHIFDTRISVPRTPGGDDG